MPTTYLDEHEDAEKAVRRVEPYDGRDVTQISDEQLQRTLATNIFSRFYMARSALAHPGDGEAIIATASVNAFKGNDTLIRRFVHQGRDPGLVRSLAQDRVDRGIRVMRSLRAWSGSR